jgi:hypothetical protein
VNIYQRINEVRKAISKVAKDKKVEGYMAVTHDQVTALTRDHFVDQGVIIIPRITSERTVPTGTFTSRDTPFVRYEATYDFDVVNADDPADKFTAAIGAHAIDHGDKAPGKALSYAKKALVLKLLELESVTDEEGRQEQHKGKEQKYQSVAKDTWDEMTREQKKKLTDMSVDVIDHLKEGQDQRAFELYEEYKTKLDTEEQVAFWSRFDSTQRNTIKTLGAAWRAAEEKRKLPKEAH